MKYEPEEILVAKIQSGEYGWKEYIGHHSRELKQEYESYCRHQGLDPQNEETAVLFIEMKEQQLEAAMATGNA